MPRDLESRTTAAARDTRHAAITQRLGYRLAVARTVALGANCFRSQHIDASGADSLALYCDSTERPWIVVDLTSLRVLANETEVEESIRRYQVEAMSMARQLSDDWRTRIGSGAAAQNVNGVIANPQTVPTEQSLDDYRKRVLRWGVANSVAALASRAVARGDADCAARLFGAADAFHAVHGIQVPPNFRPEWEAAKLRARVQLGEEQFEAAFVAGRELTPRQAIAEATGLEMFVATSA